MESARSDAPAGETTATAGETRPWFKRTRFFIDPQLQLAVALPLMAIPLIAAVAYVLAVRLLPGESVMRTMTAEETRRLFLHANLIYGAIAAATLGAVAVFLTHRIAGPAWVIEQAVRGMTTGDPMRRLSLRPGDSLQSLAESVCELRDRLMERDERQRLLLAEMAALLEQGDTLGCQEILERLGELDRKPLARAAEDDAR